MRIGVILNSNDAETVWNALRFGTTALLAGHTVKAFLIGRGVELEDIRSEKFDVTSHIEAFRKNGGVILACGTCLKMHGKGGSEVCPTSTMKDLLWMVEEADKIITFG